MVIAVCSSISGSVGADLSAELIETPFEMCGLRNNVLGWGPWEGALWG